MRPSHRYSPEGTASAILLLILIGIVAVQILGRTPLLQGPVWTEEAARWVWVWMAFLGIAEVERQNRHLRMGFLGSMLPRRIRTIVFTGVDLAYLGVMAQLCWIGWQTVGRTLDTASVTLPLPTAALYGSAFLSSILVIHRIARRIIAGQSGNIDGGEIL